MKIAAVVFNVVLFAITCLIVLTEGIPRKTPYFILTLLPLVVPTLNLVRLIRDGTSWPRQIAHAPAVICNFVLIAFVCWAAVAQYPYPEGNSVIPFALLMAFTPIISLLVLLRGGKAERQEEQSTVAEQR